MYTRKEAIKSTFCVVWCYHKKMWKKKKKFSEVEEEEGEGGKVEGLPKQNDKPLGNIVEGGDGANGAAAPLLSANLPHSSIYKHQLPQKSGCLLSINRNHSPMVHLIMRPHTELRLDAAHHCLGQPASHPCSRPTPAPTPAHGLQASWGLKEEGARCEGADPPAPTGLLDEWAARCRQSAWGQSQVCTSTKRNVRDLTARDYYRGSRFFFLTWNIT